MAVTKTQNVILLHYNNYFNRIIKKLETVQDYKDADTESVGGSTPIIHYSECLNINFNPSDGIATSLVLGFGTNPNTVDTTYDYLIVVDRQEDDSTTPATITDTVNSRWYIIEIERTRGNQYELTLKRDVIADKYDEVLKAPTYIEKGLLAQNNPLIFNKEGVTFNQIKESEDLLIDNSKVPWLVAYIAKNASGDDIVINYNPADQNFVEVSAANIGAWAYSGYDSSNPFLGTPYNISYKTYFQSGEWWIYN